MFLELGWRLWELLVGTQQSSKTAMADQAHKECTALIEGVGEETAFVTVKQGHHVGQQAHPWGPLRREGMHDVGLQGVVGHTHALYIIFVSC